MKVSDSQFKESQNTIEIIHIVYTELLYPAMKYHGTRNVVALDNKKGQEEYFMEICKHV